MFCFPWINVAQIVMSTRTLRLSNIKVREGSSTRERNEETVRNEYLFLGIKITSNNVKWVRYSPIKNILHSKKKHTRKRKSDNDS